MKLKDSVYIGEVDTNGNPHGKGKCTYTDASVYEGDWVGGKRHGKGKVTTRCGSFYEGDWVNGKRHGKGKNTTKDGSVYEGDFVEDTASGKGKCIYADGSVYEGDWVNDNRHGKGKMTTEYGSVYEGDFVEQYCNECPECLKEDVIEDDDGWLKMYEHRYCKLAIHDGKPRGLDHLFVSTRPTKAPDWCPIKPKEIRDRYKKEITELVYELFGTIIDENGKISVLSDDDEQMRSLVIKIYDKIWKYLAQCTVQVTWNEKQYELSMDMYSTKEVIDGVRHHGFREELTINCIESGSTHVFNLREWECFLKNR